MDATKDLDANLDEFNKLIMKLANCEEDFNDEYFAVILLNSLPDTYREVKTAIKYGRDELSFDTVVNALKIRELELQSESRDKGVSLIARGRSVSRHPNVNGTGSGSKGKSKCKYRSKSRTKGKKCFYCQREGHFIKDCFKN